MKSENVCCFFATLTEMDTTRCHRKTRSSTNQEVGGSILLLCENGGLFSRLERRFKNPYYLPKRLCNLSNKPAKLYILQLLDVTQSQTSLAFLLLLVDRPTYLQ